MPKIGLLLAAALATAVALVAGGAAAQDGSGCVPAELTDPPRQAYECGGLVIEAEAGLVLGLPAGAVPDEIAIEQGAVLIEVEAGTGGFQIRTPHAIASVRGTVYVVEAHEASTSVLVVEGEVLVTRADGSDGVSLGAGEGVDVTPSEPLAVRAWGAPRVEALLARFGR